MVILGFFRETEPIAYAYVCVCVCVCVCISVCIKGEEPNFAGQANRLETQRRVVAAPVYRQSRSRIPSSSGVPSRFLISPSTDW